MNFKEWLKTIEETSTGTSCVANFARPIMPIVRRRWPEDKKKKKKS